MQPEDGLFNLLLRQHVVTEQYRSMPAAMALASTMMCWVQVDAHLQL
jgi:hypothetical protein